MTIINRELHKQTVIQTHSFQSYKNRHTEGDRNTESYRHSQTDSYGKIQSCKKTVIQSFVLSELQKQV